MDFDEYYRDHYEKVVNTGMVGKFASFYHILMERDFKKVLLQKSSKLVQAKDNISNMFGANMLPIHKLISERFRKKRTVFHTEQFLSKRMRRIYLNSMMVNLTAQSQHACSHISQTRRRPFVSGEESRQKMVEYFLYIYRVNQVYYCESRSGYLRGGKPRN
jgi:hypothetical protein